MTKTRTRLMVLLAVVVACGFFGLEAMAQEGAEAPKGESFLTLISYGGPIGFLTIILNFVGVGFAIEHFINIRRDILAPPDIIDQVEELFENGEYEEALQVCETQPAYFTNVMVAALPKVGTGFANIEKAAEQANDDEATKLFTRIGHLNFIANIAPMMGLLGTVWGMMETFATLAASDTPPTPAQLASGIQKAIVTTVLGLVVSIPMSTLFHIFRVRVIKLVGDVGSECRELLERFRD